MRCTLNMSVSLDVTARGLVEMYRLCVGKVKAKDRVRPGGDHEGPEVEYRYSSTLSLTSALDGVGGQRHAPATLPTGDRPGAHCTVDWVGH